MRTQNSLLASQWHFLGVKGRGNPLQAGCCVHPLKPHTHASQEPASVLVVDNLSWCKCCSRGKGNNVLAAPPQGPSSQGLGFRGVMDEGELKGRSPQKSSLLGSHCAFRRTGAGWGNRAVLAEQEWEVWDRPSETQNPGGMQDCQAALGSCVGRCHKPDRLGLGPLRPDVDKETACPSAQVSP